MMHKNFVRQLRVNTTEAEKKLWARLRAKQLEERRFRRQYSIGRFIVDFVCSSQKLIIEIDGGQHSVQIEQDRMRSRWLD